MNALLIQLLMFINRPCIHDQEGSEILINSDSISSKKKRNSVHDHYSTQSKVNYKCNTVACKLNICPKIT